MALVPTLGDAISAGWASNEALASEATTRAELSFQSGEKRPPIAPCLACATGVVPAFSDSLVVGFDLGEGASSLSPVGDGVTFCSEVGTVVLAEDAFVAAMRELASAFDRRVTGMVRPALYRGG